MAGTVGITYKQPVGNLYAIVWDWESDSSGDASGVFTDITVAPGGLPLRVVTVPSSVDAPTADYDIVINDIDGADILQAQGADRHTSNTEQLGFDDTTAPLPWLGPLELVVSNAGDSKGGRVVLYYTVDATAELNEAVHDLQTSLDRLLRTKGIG